MFGSATLAARRMVVSFTLARSFRGRSRTRPSPCDATSYSTAASDEGILHESNTCTLLAVIVVLHREKTRPRGAVVVVGLDSRWQEQEQHPCSVTSSSGKPEGTFRPLRSTNSPT